MFGKKDGNIPEIDKELERLKNLGIIENRFLSGLYGDLYGTGHRRLSQVRHRGTVEPAGAGGSR